MPISNWSTTASSNATSDAVSGILVPEGMDPAGLNDAIRALMAEVRKWYDEDFSFTAVKPTDQNVFNGSGLVTWTETHDAGGCFASNRFTATKAGNYFFTSTLTHAIGASSVDGLGGLSIRKNGSVMFTAMAQRTGAFWLASASGGMVIPLAVSDYVEIHYEMSGVTSGTPVIQSGRCIFSGFKIK